MKYIVTLFLLIFSSLSYGQNLKQVTGVITDANGESIIGASIVIKGTSRGTTTDIDGRYVLADVDPDAILEVQYLGYKTEKIKVDGRRNINIMLYEDSKALEEVVVIGYGAQKKESLASSVTSIDSKPLALASTRNLTNALAGQLPGLISVQRSGEPGYDSSEFWIRGVSSFSGGTTPLILVDGVPRSMDDIEADEIETFTLLKDAAATAVYGAEGANGVILITTKRGTTDKPRISFRAETTIATPTRLPEFMNAEETLTLYNEALRNEGSPEIYDPSLYAEGADRDLYPDTDWLDLMLRDHTYNMRYTLNVQGGSNRARYFVSGAFYQENGIFKELSNEYNTLVSR